MKRTLSLFGLFLISSLAYAQGGYFGASVGQATYEENTFLGNFDESDTAFKLFLGYRLNENIAVEGVYVDYGEPSGNLSGVPASVEFDGFGANLVGTIPLGTGFELFGKLGFLAWDGKVNLGSLSNEQDDTDLTYGVGVAYFFNEQIGIQGEWEFIDFDQSNMDGDMVSVGVQFRF